MKILLAYSSGTTSSSADTTFTDLVPIGLCSLHALLRSNGHDAQLANLSRMPSHQVASLLRELKPDLLGLSLWTHNRQATLALAGLARQLLPDCLIAAGGGHATHRAEQVLNTCPAIDLIVVGEGEAPLLELVQRLTDGRPLEQIAGLAVRSGEAVRLTGPSRPVPDLDQLPYPSAYLHEAHGIDLDLQSQFISTSRGCPSACRFCSSPAFWGTTVRTRTPASVVAECRSLRERFGTMYLSLRDDTFTADRERTIELCRLMIAERTQQFWNCQTRVETVDDEMLSWMKRAGCECVQLGVESGSPRILKELGKRITPEQVIRAADAVHRVGLSLSIYLIAAVPGETTADRAATERLVARMRPDDLQIAPLAYYPGTALYNSAVRHGNATADLFEQNQEAALTLHPEGERLAAALLQRLDRLRHRPSLPELQSTHRRTGYCAVGALQIGDYYSSIGDWQNALSAYSEITRREPDHPWGWQLLAELHEELGNRRKSLDCYRRLLELVPQHRQARCTLTQ